MEYFYIAMLALFTGFTHALEPDHIIALNNFTIHGGRYKILLWRIALWGLGHGSTILIYAILLILLQINIPEHFYQYTDAMIGILMILMGLWLLYRQKDHIHFHKHGWRIHIHPHRHIETPNHEHQHKLTIGAFITGILHGFAGSSAVLALFLSHNPSTYNILINIAIFSAGCMVSMLVFSGFLTLPVNFMSRRHPNMHQYAICALGLLSIIYGGYMAAGGLYPV